VLSHCTASGNWDTRQGKDDHDPLTEEEIARVMGVNQSTVSRILGKNMQEHNFTSDKAAVREAIRLYLQGQSHRKIAERFGVSQPTISSVIREYVSGRT
jgi:DNA-binding transcriptional regulator LsrR (DeoR family)